MASDKICLAHGALGCPDCLEVMYLNEEIEVLRKMIDLKDEALNEMGDRIRDRDDETERLHKLLKNNKISFQES